VTRLLAIPLFLTLAGCGKADVAAEMEASLLSTNHAIGIALIVSDVASYHLETPSEIPTTTDTGDTGDSGDTGTSPSRRHGQIGPCPELFALSDDLIEVDYGTGCLPRSGLMPVVVAGATLVVRDGTRFDGDFDTYAINLSHFITGTMSAEVTGTEGNLDITTDFDLTATDGTESLDAAGTITAAFTAETVSLNGTVKIKEKGSVRHSLDKVKLALSDIPGECPEPAKGHATAHRDADAIVDYAKPGGGQVTVELGKRTSDNVRLCAFDSWIF